MKNCLELAIRTEGAVGSVAPTIEQGIVLAIHLPNAMAKAELDILLNKLSGRLTGDSKFYSTHRHGKTVISNYPLQKDPKTISATQRANSASFGERSKQATSELADPTRHAYWQERYEQYKKLANKNVTRANTQFFGADIVKPADKYYTTLRGFVIAQLATLAN